MNIDTSKKKKEEKKEEDTGQINTIVQKETKVKKGAGVADTKDDGVGVDVVQTADYKVNAAGKKYKAHRIVFNKGHDDGTGKQGVTEQMKKSFNSFVEQHGVDLTEEQTNELIAELQEVLSKDADAGQWISDFVKSENPKFKGKSKDKRKQMALAAYYAAQRNEETVTEGKEDKVKDGDKPFDYNEWKNSGKKPRALPGWGPKGKITQMNKDIAKIKKEQGVSEEVEQFDEEFEVILEAYHPDDYEASSEKSQFGGHRAIVKHKETGRVVYAGGNAYKKAEHAKGEAETYRTHYSASGKGGPGAVYRHDTAISKYRKAAKEAGHLREGWDDMVAASKKRSEVGKTSTATKHDIKKTSTGTVYTKQRDADGNSKEFNRSGEAAQKRGRGRPKKSSFGEAVEFLMGLDEETFDSMMEEGFDAFMEHYEQLDEVSKATLGSYVKKAVSGMNGVAVNAHQAGGQKPGSPEINNFLTKARKRIAGIDKATDRLTK